MATGHLTVSPDTTYDIGAAGATRPRDLYLARNAHVSNNAYVSGTLFAPLVNTDVVEGTSSLGFKANGATRWYIGTTGHFLANVDATYDLGSASLRPRDTYLGRDLYLAVGVNSARIRMPLSQATVAQRALIQSSVLNGETSVGAMPNGTSQQAAFVAFNKANDPDNAAYLGAGVHGTAAFLSSGALGTGTVLPMSLQVGGVERVRIGTDGATYAGMLRVDNWVNLGAGAGMELGYYAPGLYANILVYDRSAGAYRDLNITAKNIQLAINGGKLTLPANSVQAPLGNYLGAGTYSTTTTSTWAISPLAITVACSGGLLRFEVSTAVQHTVAGGTIILGIAMDGAPTLPSRMIVGCSTASFAVPVTWIDYGQPPAGTHTFAIMINNATAGTATLGHSWMYTTLWVTEQKF